MILFLILIILASVIIGFFILIQNPKGGGLAGNIAGFNSQFMGVKQTTDVLEKGTWVMAAVIALLCIFSVFFIPRTNSVRGRDQGKPPAATQQTAPTPANNTPATTPNNP